MSRGLHMASRQHGLPVLTVIFNNQQWEAVKQSALAVHPDGWAKSTGRYPLSELSPRRATRRSSAPSTAMASAPRRRRRSAPALRRALAAVRRGRQAVVNAVCGRARE